MIGKAREIYNRLKKSYRFAVTDKTTFVEIYSRSVSKLHFYLAFLGVILVGFIFALLLLFFSPLKFAVPGFPTKRTHEMIVKNAIAVDSLEKELQRRDQYLEKIKAVISGEIIEDTTKYSTGGESEVKLQPMEDDEMFNKLIATDDLKITSSTMQKDVEEINNLNLYTPLFGLVTNKFEASPGHFGTDVVGRPSAPISAIYNGIVIFAEWSVTTGFVVVIQHNFNLLSVYKHNSKVFVKSGDRVKSGELIAIIGNEGEYSTGPHLHLEMWQNGIPLNPEDYFDFRN